MLLQEHVAYILEPRVPDGWVESIRSGNGISDEDEEQEEEAAGQIAPESPNSESRDEPLPGNEEPHVRGPINQVLPTATAQAESVSIASPEPVQLSPPVRRSTRCVEAWT